MANLVRISVLTLAILLYVVFVHCCDPLVHREGVHVKCTLPRGGPESRASSAVVDCHDQRRRISLGTVASYRCDEPHYKPERDIRDFGRAATEQVMKCLSNGNGTSTAWIDEGGLEGFHQLSCTLNCGVLHAPTVTGLIINGSVTPQTDWPWHATIFTRSNPKSSQFDYICGGSLIKPDGAQEFFVLTAAHCLETGGRVAAPRHVDDVRVVLGADQPDYEELSAGRAAIQILRVKEIILHGSYDGWRSVFQSDIALIRFHTRAQPRLTRHVLPVCLSRTAGRPTLGSAGHIAGFGLYEPGSVAHSTTLRRATIPVVHPDKCSVWRPNRKLSAQEICAGTESDQNACNGDSGGGLVFNSTDARGVSRFYLQGIVSHGRSVVEVAVVASCDSYAVFTKVNSYLEWISEVMEGFGDQDNQDSSAWSKTRSNIDVDSITFNEGEIPTITRTAPSPVPAPPPAALAPPDNCGIIKNRANNSTKNIGIVSSSSDWPWQASILSRSKSNSSEFMYSCSGTLIPSEGKRLVVLTAASCVTDKPVTELRVVLGLLQQQLEGMEVHSPDAQTYEVRSVTIHESFNTTEMEHDSFYDHDIAILQLGRLISNSSLNRSSGSNEIPACLPPPATAKNPAPVPKDVGHIAGFRTGLFRSPSGGSGTNQTQRNSVISRLTRTTFPVALPQNCSDDIVRSESHIFCVQTQSIIANPCHARRGSGFIIDRVDNARGVARFYVEGIVSRGNSGAGAGGGVFFSAALACQFGAFTRVGAYINWIKEAVTKLSE